MTNDFSQLVPDTNAFLRALSENNNRDWFNANKARYERELKTPALMLLDQMAADFGPGTGSKLFRPQRDIRFSKDKTPYHIHLHMLWTLPGGDAPATALFFGIAPDYVSAGGGVMSFDKPALERWRQAMDGDAGDEMRELVDGYLEDGLRLNDPPLKRVPAPYGQDHRNGALLRRKGLALWYDLSAAEQADPVAALRGLHNRLQPLFRRLQQIF